METKALSSCSNKSNNKAKSNKLKRKEILEKKKAMDELIKLASAQQDHLSAFHAFRHYHKNGLSACLESGTGDKLSASLKQYIQNLLKINMEGAYGTEWGVEEKVKRREMVASEARYIFVYEALDANGAIDLLTMSEKERSSGGCVEERGPCLDLCIFALTLRKMCLWFMCMSCSLSIVCKGKVLGSF